MPKQNKGPRGARGIPGPPGPRGSAGSDGHQGPAGKVGPVGAVGRSGARGPKGAKGLTRADPGATGRRRLILAVERHIENIYAELTVQMQRMAKIQAQVDDLRAKLRKAI